MPESPFAIFSLIILLLLLDFLCVHGLLFDIIRSQGKRAEL